MKRMRRQKNVNGKHVYAKIGSIDENESAAEKRLDDAIRRGLGANNFSSVQKVNPAHAANSEYIKNLKNLPYQEYLQTAHWQKIKVWALGFAKYRCMLCYSGGKLNVHHRTYERLGE